MYSVSIVALLKHRSYSVVMVGIFEQSWGLGFKFEEMIFRVAESALNLPLCIRYTFMIVNTLLKFKNNWGAPSNLKATPILYFTSFTILVIQSHLGPRFRSLDLGPR